MLKRFTTVAAPFLISLSLVACGGGDDDSSKPSSPSWGGHTYMLTIKRGDWSVPKGIGADLFSVAPAFLFDVQGSGSNLTTTLGYGTATMLDADRNAVALSPDQIKQDTCGPTTTATVVPGDGAKSTITIPQMKMHVVNTAPMSGPLQVTADVFNLSFTDVLPNGSTPSATGKLQATMDFKQLYILFATLGPTRTADSVCKALSDHYTPSACMDDSCKVSCEPCPNAAAGDVPTCLTVEAEDIGALLADDHKVNPITSVDATCADSPAPTSM
jgi:hypothetical protein